MNSNTESSHSYRRHASYKLNEFFNPKQDSDKRRKAEIELDNLQFKIDQMLSSMSSESPPGGRAPTEDECVICFSAPAIMQTFPCGHKVVCRRCLVKTIQMAVCQRCLPLRCVVCRDKILRLHHTLPHPGAAYSTAKAVAPTFFTPPLSKCSRLSIRSNINIELLHKPWKPTSFSFRATRHSPKTNPDSKSPRVDSQRDTCSHFDTFVSSHDDTFSQNPQRNAQTPERRRRVGLLLDKHDDRKSEHDLLRAQSCKIYPEKISPVYSFLDSNQTMCSPSSVSGATPKLNKATRFLSKLWPKSSRRKQNLGIKND